MDKTATVVDRLSGKIVFTGTIKKCLEFIEANDNGFLTVYP